MRYAERAYGWHDDAFDPLDEPPRPAISVDDSRQVDTGLVTARGMPIMRLQPPVGFGRDEEH